MLPMRYKSKKKGRNIMKSAKKTAQKAIKSLAKNTLKRDANSTSCIWVYQPKAPADLKKFSKIRNDK